MLVTVFRIQIEATWILMARVYLTRRVLCAFFSLPSAARETDVFPGRERNVGFISCFFCFIGLCDTNASDRTGDKFRVHDRPQEIMGQCGVTDGHPCAMRGSQ